MLHRKVSFLVSFFHHSHSSYVTNLVPLLILYLDSDTTMLVSISWLCFLHLDSALRCNGCFLVSVFTSLTYLLCFTPLASFISIFGFRHCNLDFVYWFCFSIINISPTLHISRDSWFLYLDLDTTHRPFIGALSSPILSDCLDKI